MWNSGISVGGVIAFVFADLIVLPILDIHRRHDDETKGAVYRSSPRAGGMLIETRVQRDEMRMMSDLPIVCTLQPGDLNARAMELLPGIAARALHRVAIEDGYRLEFAPGTPSLNDIAAMIDAERRCCRFLRFRLTAEPDEGVVSLELTGPPGTREFLADLITV